MFVKSTTIVVVKPIMNRGEILPAGTVLSPAQIRSIRHLDSLLSNGVLKALPDPHRRKATKAGTSKPTHLPADVALDLSNDTLTAAFTSTPTLLSVAFNGSTSTATNTITDWVWDFGDLTAVVTEQDANITHVYSEAGTYTVGLRVINSLDQVSDVTEHDVTVAAA